MPAIPPRDPTVAAVVPPPSGVQPRRSWFKKALITLSLVAGLFWLWMFAVWPPPLWYRWFWPRQTAFMAMRADQADSLMRHAQRRKDVVEGALPRHYRPVPLEAIARSAPTAVLIAEDHRFFEHGGVDLTAIRTALGYRRDGFEWGSARDRAEMRRVLGQTWERRDRIRGASTITQQLAKNLYLSPSRNPLRKLKEALTAYRLEWAMSKSRLLELYLNVVEFGPEIWGIEAAAQYYYKRSAANLTADQAAALAGTLPFPLRSNPGFRPGRMRWRQQLVLRRMRGEAIEIPSDALGDPKEAPEDSATNR